MTLTKRKYFKINQILKLHGFHVSKLQEEHNICSEHNKTENEKNICKI